MRTHFYYTPIYYVLAQFSRTIRPGDEAVQADKKLEGLDDDALHASATVNSDGLLSVQLLNTTKEPTIMLPPNKRFPELTLCAVVG